MEKLMHQLVGLLEDAIQARCEVNPSAQVRRQGQQPLISEEPDFPCHPIRQAVDRGHLSLENDPGLNRVIAAHSDSPSLSSW